MDVGNSAAHDDDDDRHFCHLATQCLTVSVMLCAVVVNSQSVAEAHQSHVNDMCLCCIINV